MNIIRIIREEINDFDWVKNIVEPKVGDKFIHAGMGEYEKARTDYSHYIVNIDDGWIDFKDKAGRFYSSRHEDFLSSHAKNIIREELNESDGLKWIKDIKPSLSDIFNNGLINVGDIITLSGKLFDEDGRRPKEVQDFKIKIDSVGESLNSSYFTPLQEKYREFLGDDGGYVRFWKTDAEMKVVAHIKKGGIKESEEFEDFEWAKDSENPIEYLNKHYDKRIPDGYGIIKPQDELLNVLKQDYRALFGVIRQPNKIYWEITDVHHPIKKLLSYEDFKDPEIRKLIKNYYKDKINSLNKKIKSHFPDDRQ